MTRRFTLILIIAMLLSMSQTLTAQEGAFADALRSSQNNNTPEEALTEGEDVLSEPTDDALEASTPDEVPDVVPVQVFEPPECAYVPNQPTSDACRAIMEAHPEPDVTPIRQDGYTLSRYTFWRVGPHAVAKFNAPNGEVVGHIGEGFNFVRVMDGSVDGWIQIQGGEWVQRSDGYAVPASRFTGVLLPEGWNQPFGWILDTTGIYASLYPGGPSTSESGLVPLHYERYNIFAEAVDDDGWTWYMVGPDQWVKQIYMTVIFPVERPEGVRGRWVAIDLFEQSLVAYEDDTPVFATLISSGLPGTETNEGLFEVWARLERGGMSGFTGAPNAYDLQSVPWVMYYDGDISLHGTYWHDLFGYRRSRGCVNLSISDAKWVYDWTGGTDLRNDKGEILTYVYVYSTGEYR